MSDLFDPRHGPIVVEAEVTGPARSMTVDLILDTGARTSLLSEATQLALGYVLAGVTDCVRMATASQVSSVPRVVLTRLTALGRHHFGSPVLAHSLPIGTSVRGLLGLDSLRDGVLTVDFRAGRIHLP